MSLSVSTAPPTPTSWRHPAELPHICAFVGTTHSDLAIIRLLRATALTIPPRPPTTASSRSPIQVHPATGSPVSLPRGYRLPLLWVTKFLYTSLALVLTADPSIRQREWDNAKFELLHVARLCGTLLDAARSTTSRDRNWRCPAFDRALRRYWHDWLIMRDEFVRDFWREFGEEEYQGDVLKLNWGAWVLRGHKGFTLTKAEVADGITAEEFVRGLVIDEERGTFWWQEDPSEVQAEVISSLPFALDVRIVTESAFVMLGSGFKSRGRREFSVDALQRYFHFVKFRFPPFERRLQLVKRNIRITI
ncbi:hypothetical protein C8R46DRAFT_1033101 [Mycena filopes]|nr:hypothetical protein C8R46DRAFT_1033101 [Mycena filopes]